MTLYTYRPFTSVPMLRNYDAWQEMTTISH